MRGGPERDGAGAGGRDGEAAPPPGARFCRPATTYAPLLPRLARGEPSAPSDRRTGPRLGDWARGLVTDVLA